MTETTESLVRIHGLVHHPRLNGQRGFVLEKAGPDRYQIELEGTKELKSVPLKNLRPEGTVRPRTKRAKVPERAFVGLRTKKELESLETSQEGNARAGAELCALFIHMSYWRGTQLVYYTVYSISDELLHDPVYGIQDHVASRGI